MAKPRDLEIGDIQADGSIFIGTLELKNEEVSNSLRKVFNLYAAAEDMADTDGQKLSENFYTAVERVAAMPNGFNHKAKGKNPEEALLEALLSGSYKGEWFIPPKEVFKNNLQENRGLIASKGAFSEYFYWSCTEVDEDDYTWMQSMGGSLVAGFRESSKARVRLVRAEEEETFKQRQIKRMVLASERQQIIDSQNQEGHIPRRRPPPKFGT